MPTRRSRSTRFRAIALGGAVAVTLGAVPPAGAQTLFGSGSSAAQPYMLKLFKRYHQLHRKINFSFSAPGGNAGVQKVQAGVVDFAVNSRPPLPSDSGTTYYKLFLDGLCVDVNTTNHLSNVSTAQLKDIFTGVDSNWSQVAGSALSSTIDPQGRGPAAGTYTFFQSAVLGGATQSSNVTQQGSDGQVAIAVQNDPNSIGYVGLSHATGSRLRKLTVNGVPCSDASIKSEQYPLFRYIWGVVPSRHPNIQVQRFFDWVRVSHAAGIVIRNAGAVPAFNH